MDPSRRGFIAGVGALAAVGGLLGERRPSTFWSGMICTQQVRDTSIFANLAQYSDSRGVPVHPIWTDDLKAGFEALCASVEAAAGEPRFLALDTRGIVESRTHWKIAGQWLPRLRSVVSGTQTFCLLTVEERWDTIPLAYMYCSDVVVRPLRHASGGIECVVRKDRGHLDASRMPPGVLLRPRIV